MNEPRFSYDEACEVLARHFLQDDIYTDEAARLLAQHIQEAIEDWIAFQEQ